MRARGTGEEEGLRRKEVGKEIREIKEGKAMGVDGIPGEAWKYGGGDLERWVWELCNKVWRGEGWPEEWKEGVMVPIVKKREGARVEEYGGVTLMSTLYKIYAAMLAERLREDVERKKIVPQNQTGFRKGMGTIDNIYVLNYLVNRQIEKKGKMLRFFIDLRAAFDRMDRKVLVGEMRRQGVREGLVERVEEMLRESINRVRVGGKMGEKFWTVRDVLDRQGCPLSPLLFNLLMAELEEGLRKGRWGGVRLGEEKIYSLAYADDVVLLA